MTQTEFNWSFKPRCPRCHASADQRCGANPTRDPEACESFVIHAAATGYYADVETGA